MLFCLFEAVLWFFFSPSTLIPQSKELIKDLSFFFISFFLLCYKNVVNSQLDRNSCLKMARGNFLLFLGFSSRQYSSSILCILHIACFHIYDAFFFILLMVMQITLKRLSLWTLSSYTQSLVVFFKRWCKSLYFFITWE